MHSLTYRYILVAERIGIWFGVTDLEVDGTFKYDSDGSSLPFTPVWGSGESTAGTTENCVQFYDQGEKWQVYKCEETSFSICERLP